MACRVSDHDYGRAPFVVSAARGCRIIRQLRPPASIERGSIVGGAETQCLFDIAAFGSCLRYSPVTDA